MNSSAVRKLTDLRANGGYYTCFLRGGLPTSCVKLSSYEHHDPKNHDDPHRVICLLFLYFCKVDESQRWHQYDTQKRYIKNVFFK